RDVPPRLASPAGEAAALQAAYGLESALGLDCAHRLQLRPWLLTYRRTRPPGRSADDGGRAPADRRTQRALDGHRRRRLPHREPWVQRVRARGRHRLPRVLDTLARPGIHHGLLPDPRPRTEGSRRGRGVATLDPPSRRVPERVTRDPGNARAGGAPRDERS